MSLTITTTTTTPAPATRAWALRFYAARVLKPALRDPEDLEARTRWHLALLSWSARHLALLSWSAIVSCGLIAASLNLDRPIPAFLAGAVAGLVPAAAVVGSTMRRAQRLAAEVIDLVPQLELDQNQRGLSWRVVGVGNGAKPWIVEFVSQKRPRCWHFRRAYPVVRLPDGRLVLELLEEPGVALYGLAVAKEGAHDDAPAARRSSPPSWRTGWSP